MKDLPGGQIVPAARPVDAFIRPAQLQARAGLPQLRISGAPQINTIQQGSGGSIQGSNQWAQLAGALAPFNEALTKTAMTGVQMYAQGEYEKGRNDAVRAQILSNQQRLQGGAAYAAETRRVEGVDPEAAQMMDRVNPFRQAGRDNQRARLAANEAKTYILDAYNQTPGAETWKPGDPRLAGLKVKATQELLKRFPGLDESSAGFQDYVNPEIAQAWDRVSTKQAADHTNFLKGTRAKMGAVEIMQINAAARAQGRVEWTEFTTTGQAIQRSAVLGEPGFMRGVQQKIQQLVDNVHDEAGLRGESTKVIEDMLDQVIEAAGEDLRKRDPSSPEAGALSELIETLGGVQVGPPESRAPAAALFSSTFIGAAKQREQEGFEAQARAEAAALKQFSAEAATAILKAPPGTPEYGPAANALLQRAIEAGVPIDKAMEVIKNMGSTVQAVAEHATTTDDMELLFVDGKEQDPSVFDANTFMNQVRARAAGMEPGIRAGYLKRAGELIESKGRESQNSKGSVINPILTKGIKAALEAEYPQSVTEASLRGVKDIAGFMALNDPNMARAASNLEQGARLYMQQRLVQEAQKAGRRLSSAEETAFATEAFNDYLDKLEKNKKLREQTFPGGLNGGPGIEGGRVAQPGQNIRGGGQAPALPPGRKPNPVPVVTSSNLDNVDPKVLQSGAVVLRKPDTLNEIERVLQGQTPSAAVQRAARAAGMPVGQWLLRQADGYPGSVGPGARKELLRRTNQGQAAGQKVSQAGQSSGSPFAAAGMWMADILMGTRPAMASQGGGGNQFPFLRRPEAGGGFPSGGRYVPIKGVIITSAVDPESPGFDMAIEGGRRGAQFRWPFSFRVVGMEVNRRENNMERTGNRSDRFYGTNVTLRFRSPVDGREYDVVSAHHDSLNPALRRGGSYPAGTFLGTQGRTGSTTGTHTSLDVYVAGTRRAAPMTVRSHLRDGFAKGSTFGGGGGRPLPAQGTLTGRATYYTGSGGSDGVLGGKTANGETFTGRQMTAAVQWSLKPKWMNKWLIVEDARTGRRIRVWANDTGQMGGTTRKPADRLIDLSPVAFTKLFGSTRQGVGNIRVTVDPNQRGRP
jgi:hypothetical protein